MPPHDNGSDALVSELADHDMLELVEMFVASLPDRIAAIEKAIDTRDLATLARLVHQLKGAAGGYGFPSITEAAREIHPDRMAREDPETLRHQVRALVDLCRRARAGAATS